MIHYICDNPETPLKVKPEYQTLINKNVLKKENCNVDCCPYIHFFTSEQNALEYLKQVQYTGPYQILNLDEANETAKALFRYQPVECGRCCQS
ncbi:hypothetical protein JL896_08785 [Staphylococcus pseudintermedius]|nr:hypothetical protein [Staphylococcus pseudintermedius]